MARIKRKRGGSYKRSGKRRATKRSTASLRRRKAKKMGRKWKAGGIPRTIVSADFQKRSMAINFEYTQQWAVSPSIMGVANSLQFITWVMNDPSNIFGAQIPFGANNSQTTGARPDYAVEQSPFGSANSTVNRQVVGSFANWSKRYEKACVIGSKVTAILRPKMVTTGSQRDAFAAPGTTTNKGVVGTDDDTTQAFPAVDTTHGALDASRIVTLMTDAKPFDTDAESISLTTHVPDLIKRSGVRQKRMSYTPAGKDGAFATLNYSAKKFANVKDIKDNAHLWSGIDQSTGYLTQVSPNGTATVPVYGIIAIQKEELTSPSASPSLSFKKQHDYYIETKYSCTVLFRDPYEIAGTNVPTVTGTGNAGGVGRDDQMSFN